MYNNNNSEILTQKECSYYKMSQKSVLLYVDDILNCLDSVRSLQLQLDIVKYLNMLSNHITLRLAKFGHSERNMTITVENSCTSHCMGLFCFTIKGLSI